MFTTYQHVYNYARTIQRWMSENKSTPAEDGKKVLTHIAGTYVIDAMPSFLNGGGLSKGVEDRNYTIVKTFQDGNTGEGDKRPYNVVFVSAQSFRRMLRDTLIQETNWPKSQIRALRKGQYRQSRRRI
jgi:hypothetical protein